MLALYCVPTLPFGIDAVVMVSTAFTVMLRFAVTDCVGVLESVTLAVKLNVPMDVGAPVIAPVLGVSVSPGGRLPALILQV